MKCRSCGLEIADKAIVCYRCGTPTADPRPPALQPRRRPGWLGLVIGAAIGVVILLAMVLTPSGTPERWGEWIALAIVVVVGTVFWRRRPRGR
jgi:hypothetical protein